MEPLNEFNPLTIVGQTLNTNKDKKRYYTRVKKAKQLHDEEEAIRSDNDTNGVAVERRSGQDRREQSHQHHRFNLRTKKDRRKAKTLSLTA